MADDEFTHRKALERASRAKALAEDPLLQEAFASLENEMMAVWAGSRMDATAERERVWVLMKAIARFKHHLATVISDGKVSNAVLNDMLGRNAA